MEFDVAKIAPILDSWLPNKIVSEHIPGISVGVARSGELVYGNGFGYADVENGISATTNTRYRIASISKTFTAVSLFQLQEKGLIKLVHPIGKYLPWLSAELSAIPISDLLSHQAGVSRDGDTRHWSDDNFPNLDELKEVANRVGLYPEYRHSLKYSNFGFALLGQVIELVTGVPYAEYERKNILLPLQMQDTFPDFETGAKSDLAKGYSRYIPGESREVYPDISTIAYASATGYISTVHDLATYSGVFTKGTELLKKSSVTRILTEAARVSTSKDDGSYGYGCRIWHLHKRKICGHSGGFAGYRTWLAIDVKNDIAVIVLTNTTDGAAGKIANGIFETIYMFPKLESKFKKKALTRSTSAYEGTYRGRYGDTVVVRNQDFLIAINPRQDSPLDNALLLTEEGVGKYKINGGSRIDSPGEAVVFECFKDGRAGRMVLGTLPQYRIN